MRSLCSVNSLSGSKVSELFRFSRGRMLTGPWTLKQGQREARESDQQLSGYWFTSGLLQSLIIRTFQWIMKPDSDTAGGRRTRHTDPCSSVVTDEIMACTYIQVNVLFCFFFFMNPIKSQLSSLQGLKASCADNKAITSSTQRWPNPQTFKVTFCFTWRLLHLDASETFCIIPCKVFYWSHKQGF